MVAASQAFNAYQHANVYEGMDPNRLTLMLYEEALRQLDLSKEGVLTGDAQKRGEHLGKAIAIIAELNAALDSKINDDPIEFLRGLYQAILLDLPKVAITKDIRIIERAHKYLSFLCGIWKKNVMGEDSRIDVASGRTEETSEYKNHSRMQTRTVNPYANMGKLNRVSLSV